MGKITRRRHTRKFKTSIIRELESGKNLAQISRENNLHPTMISRWKLEYRKNPESAFSGNGNIYKEAAKNQELERLVGKLYAENEFLKKAFQRSIRPDSGPNLEIQIREEIQNIVIEFPGYGYRRVTIELQNRDYSVKEKIVRKFMKEDNLLCVKRRFRLQTTDSNHGEKIYPNLARYLKITGINQLWVADITYIQLSKEFVFLAVIIDVFSRRCIGWELSRHIDTDLTLNALRNDFRKRKGNDLNILIHHSDQGVQYASKEYVDCLKRHGILVSMSRKGNPYDNAFAESFIKTLKCEEVYLNEYGTFNDALTNIDRFIEEVYNSKRLNSSIGYKSPISFENALTLNIVA